MYTIKCNIIKLNCNINFVFIISYYRLYSIDFMIRFINEYVQVLFPSYFEGSP